MSDNTTKTQCTGCSFVVCSRFQTAVHFLSVSISDSADVESFEQDSSDEESERRGAEKPKGEVTSMDEALRAVAGCADHSQEDFLKQNFETLAESCSIGRRLARDSLAQLLKDIETFWGKCLFGFSC